MSISVQGGYVYCGAGSSLINGVIAVVPKMTGVGSRKRIVTLDSSGNMASFVLNIGTGSEVPFVADDWGARIAAKALEGALAGQYIIEIAAIHNGVRVRLSDGRAFDIVDANGEIKKEREEDHCIRVTSHDFYTFFDKKFYKSADGSDGGLIPMADGDILYVIESGDRDYKVYLKEENGTPVAYFEDTKLTGVYEGMPIFAYEDGGTKVYFSDGKLANISDGTSISVSAAGWLDLERTMALHVLRGRAGSEQSLSGAVPPAQAAWLDDHGAWRETQWAGVGILGATLPTPQPFLFKYTSQANWQYPSLSGGFYVADGKLHIGGNEFSVTSATGSALMQIIETSATPVYSLGGVTEKVDAGEIINYGVGYKGSRWSWLAPSDFNVQTTRKVVAA